MKHIINCKFIIVVVDNDICKFLNKSEMFMELTRTYTRLQRNYTYMALTAFG